MLGFADQMGIVPGNYSHNPGMAETAESSNAGAQLKVRGAEWQRVLN